MPSLETSFFDRLSAVDFHCAFFAFCFSQPPRRIGRRRDGA